MLGPASRPRTSSGRARRSWLAGLSLPGALSRDEIREFVRRKHAHAGDPPAGFLWGYALFNGPPSDPVYDGPPRFSSKAEGVRPLNLVRWPLTLIGVAMVGRVASRVAEQKHLAAGERVADVTRLALDHGLPPFVTYKASSELYARAAEDAERLGYDRIQTFTLESESGMSLRYARWQPVGTSKGGQFSRPSRARTIRAGELAGAKTRWEKKLRHA